jgi:purine-binding chemotaxis protein CheW
MIQGDQAFFIFKTHDRLIGLSLAQVDRVLPAARLLNAPQGSTGLAGFLNYRGRVIPVLDLRAILGLPAELLRPSQRIVLVRAGTGSVMGLIADEVLGIHAADRMQRLPKEFEGLPVHQAIEGFIAIGDKMAAVCSLRKILASSRIGLNAALQDVPDAPVEPEP